MMNHYNQELWNRIFQPCHQDLDQSEIIGGDLVVDQAIENMNDMVRFIQLSTMSSFPVIPLCSASSGESFYADNTFRYNRDNDQTIIPPNFVASYRRYEKIPGLKIALVGSLLWTVNPNGEDVQEVFYSCIIIDSVRKVAHRIDPETSIKEELDSSIVRALKEAGCECVYLSPEAESLKAKQPGPVYRMWDDLLSTLPALKNFPEYVRLKMAIFFLIHVRLSFPHYEHNNLWEEFSQQIGKLKHNEVEKLILNFYPSFTSLGNFCAFGSADYINDRNDARDLWN